jgi:hypothetical protein
MEDLFLGRGITDRLLLNGSRREGGDGFRVEGAPMHHWGIGKGPKREVSMFRCIAGLFTLANYEETALDGVFAPFSAGCGSIVQYPYPENSKDRPKDVIGIFDVSARSYVTKDELSFAVPINKSKCMVDDMDESFLITLSWAKVKKRI